MNFIQSYSSGRSQTVRDGSTYRLGTAGCYPTPIVAKFSSDPLAILDGSLEIRHPPLQL